MKDIFLHFILACVIFSCSIQEVKAPSISIISITVNGTNLLANATNVVPNSKFEIVFTSALSVSNFETSISISSTQGSEILNTNYSHANSKVIIDLNLSYSTTYTLHIIAGSIGVNGEVLTEPIIINFTTSEDDTIRSMEPCSGVEGCLRTIELTTSNGSANFSFYSNYPIYEEKASWENLKNAIIVVHGVNRNANDYYSYINNTLKTEDIEQSTILISPYFKNAINANENDFYWSSSNWREGQKSSNDNKLSSFEIMDLIIGQLSNKVLFPVLEKIIITGHSSGGLFTDTYGPANKAENNHPEISFTYIVANSQYLYYPNDFRYNESTNQFYEPSNCIAFNYWPLGYNGRPAYLQEVSKETFDQQFISRDIINLIGNGNDSDGSLNTTNCEMVLLGSSRYKRGENRFSMMDYFFSGAHSHTKTVVNGISHNGQGMYQSPEFKSLLNNLVQ